MRQSDQRVSSGSGGCAAASRLVKETVISDLVNIVAVFLSTRASSTNILNNCKCNFHHFVEQEAPVWGLLFVLCRPQSEFHFHRDSESVAVKCLADRFNVIVGIERILLFAVAEFVGEIEQHAFVDLNSQPA